MASRAGGTAKHGGKTAVGTRASVPAAVRRQRQRDKLLRTFARRVLRDCQYAHQCIRLAVTRDTTELIPLMTLIDDLQRDARFLADDAERVGKRR